MVTEHVERNGNFHEPALTPALSRPTGGCHERGVGEERSSPMSRSQGAGALHQPERGHAVRSTPNAEPLRTASPARYFRFTRRA
jgi:hypothetical protein